MELSGFLTNAVVLVIGGVLGYWVSLKQINKKIWLEKRLECVVDFVSSAYPGVLYLYDTRINSTQRGSRMREAIDSGFYNKAMKASFFLSESLSKEVGDFIAMHRDLLELTETDELLVVYKQALEKLTQVEKQLKKEVQKEPSLWESIFGREKESTTEEEQ